MTHPTTHSQDTERATPIQVWPERTPNPNSMKFRVNRQLVTDPVSFENSLDAERSPLASKIFGFPWSSGVYIGTDFITITKQDWVDWEMLAEPLAGLLREFFEVGEPVLKDPAPMPSEEASDQEDTPQVRLIKKLIEQEIRPAVAMDGGDIIFHRYENQRVYLYMKGSCSGCPSATITLKQGIEARIQEELPEVIEVIAL